MSELNRLLQENQKLKNQLSKDKQILGASSYIDDAILKGGYRVVRTIKERNAIDCCFRKLGMKVMVIGQNYSYKDYILQGEDPCKNDMWVLDEGGSGGGFPDTIDDSDVTLLDDYSQLDSSGNIQTQQDLNLVLARLVTALINTYRASDKYFIHDQFNPSSTWVIHHDLDKKPAITVTDTAGTQVEGAIEYLNDNEVRLTFNFPFSGYAYLN